MNFVQPDLDGLPFSILDTLKGICFVAMIFLPTVLIIYGLPQTAFTVFGSLVIPLMFLFLISTLVRWAKGGGDI